MFSLQSKQWRKGNIIKVHFIPKLTQKKDGLCLVAPQGGHHVLSVLLLPSSDDRGFSLSQ